MLDNERAEAILTRSLSLWTIGVGGTGIALVRGPPRLTSMSGN